MEPDGMLIEVWRCLGDIAIVWLTKLINHIFRSNKMPDEWRRNILEGQVVPRNDTFRYLG